MIAALRPLLDTDDLIIDCGNANFHDTRRRAAEAAAQGSPYLGVGVSGGEEGARHGPSIMGGGPKAAWDRVAPILEAIAAKFDGTPCATWMGTDGAGHFVKTVHNGIEYADMQMIAEIYGIMRDGLGMDARGGRRWPSRRWNGGPLKSYLIEITGNVARAIDPDTGKPVIDVILDRAGQKGTGRWTAIEALHARRARHAPSRRRSPRATSRPASTSARRARRSSARPTGAMPGADGPLDRLEEALLAGKIACYAQGFGLLAAASQEFGWSLPMAGIARVWRAGCIIRSAMLDDMAQALGGDAGDEPDVRAALRRAAAPRPTAACARSSPQAALAGDPDAGARRGARLFRHDAHPRAPPRTCCRPSATSSARTASSGSTSPARTTAPGAATRPGRRTRRRTNARM